MFEQAEDQQLMMEGRIIKEGAVARATVPLPIRRKFQKAMKMDAAKFFGLPIIWHYKNGTITMTIVPPED